jgi:ketosteroid isomerase-like protein
VPAEEDKPESVKLPLLNYFDAIQRKDLGAMRANTTDDFVLFEDGRVWNNDSLWMQIQRYPNRRLEFRLTGFKVFVDKESGQISYFNHAKVFHNDSLTRQVDWIENVTLRKREGKWRINFLQSTPRK